MYTRALIPDARKSYFLFGPRQTGKSTLAKLGLTPRDLYIDLLPQRAFLDYAKTPGRFREEILAHHKRHKTFRCVVDEIQKIPALLDEIHSLIETLPVKFTLTGSSARKLKRGASNLLAGRAYTYHLFPLTFTEMKGDFSLSRALQFGTLPPACLDPKEDPKEFLKAYTETYLREEIQQEGVVRQLGPFSSFLDLAAATDGEVVNFSNMARECGVSVKTVQEYYQILEDTFLAARLPAFSKSARRKMVSHPRFYFFDPGVTNALTHQLGDDLDPLTRGRRFEQFIIQQIRAALEYARMDVELSFWRTHSGAEVDLIFSQGAKVLAAAEIKSTPAVTSAHLSGLRAFSEDFPKVPLFLISTDARERLIDDSIHSVPWDGFIAKTMGRL